MFASFKNQNLKIMATKVFINLPVKDLNKSKAFFEGLGYSFNPQFSDENAACMVISDNIFAMLLVESYFQTFTKKPVSDARSEEHTSELQSLMSISYAVFCLTKKKNKTRKQ